MNGPSACLSFTFGPEGGIMCGKTLPLRDRFDQKFKEIQYYYLNRPNGKPNIAIGKVKEGGIGNSNSIDTFKQILEDPDEFADVLGLPRGLIRGFDTIWTATLSCQIHGLLRTVLP